MNCQTWRSNHDTTYADMTSMRLYFTVAELYSTVASKFYFKLPQMVGRRIQFTLVVNNSKDHLVLSKFSTWNGESVHKKECSNRTSFHLPWSFLHPIKELHHCNKLYQNCKLRSTFPFKLLTPPERNLSRNPQNWDEALWITTGPPMHINITELCNPDNPWWDY